MTDPLRRELRQELADALSDPMRSSSMFITDYLCAVMPVVERELADARKAERERCASVADADDGMVKPGDYMADVHVGCAAYGPRVAERIAAAIRALED